MKNIFLLIYLFLTFFFFCQKSKWNIHDISNLNEISYSLNNKSLKYNDLKEKFSIFNINGVDYLPILGKKNSDFDIEKLKSEGVFVGTVINNVFTAKLPLNKIEFISNYNGINYIEIASKVKINLDNAIKDVKADSVQKGYGLPNSYTGKNVYIGITDWGFDYTHPQFYDTLLQENRIIAAWDQYKKSGNKPNNFSYGVEYDNVNELLNAKSDTSNIYSYHYHGSHVAGICAGSGANTPYRGVAFDANYLFVSILVDVASVIDAYEWMYQKSLQDQKRLVINQSWGLHHIGNLDGTSLISQAIDYYSQLGVVFVSSAGNNGDVSFHIKKTFDNDTITTRVNFYDYSFPTMWGQSVSLWGEVSKDFKVSMLVLNQTNNLLYQTNFYSTSLPDFSLDSSIVINSDTIIFKVSSESSNSLNNRPHIRFRINNKYPLYKIVLKITAFDGVVHAWNVVELTNDVGNWGMSFSKIYSYYTSGDHFYGISEPACTNSTIAVAAYQSFGTLAGFSSVGPTLDDRVKPDISAPGVNIASSISSYTDGDFNLLTSVDFNGRSYPYGRLSGTSMSSPMVTGIVALILEANPYLSSAQVKEIVQQTARTDIYTGTIPIGYSNKWGAGKVDAYNSVKIALQTIGNLGLFEKSINESELFVFPNPSSNFIKIKNLEQIKSINIIRNDGVIFDFYINNEIIDINNLPRGIYFIRYEKANKIFHEKFVKI